jgi:plastocyanin domain-containing protein
VSPRAVALAAGAAVAVALAGAAAVQALRAPPAGLSRVRTGRAAPGADGVQTVELVAAAGEYRPNVVHARAGQPLRLRVTVPAGGGCETRVLVPDLGLDLALRAGATAEALLPAARPGSYLFTCEERMVKGVIVYE